MHLSLVCIWSIPHPHGHAWQPWGPGPGHCLDSAYLWAWWDRATGGHPCPSLHIAMGSPLATWFAMPLQVLHRSQSAINYQKQTLVGSATCGSSTLSVREAGCCGSPLPARVHTYAKGSGMHMVLTCLATQVNAIGEMCLYWNPHKHKRHLHKHQQHSQPDAIRGPGQEATGSHTHRSLAAGPGLLVFAVAGPPHQLSLQLLPPDIWPPVTHGPFSSSWSLTSHPIRCAVLFQGHWWSHTCARTHTRSHSHRK